MSPLKNTGRNIQRLGSRIFRTRAADKVRMPGKSNRFDYTNRPNSGAKLGEIIGTSLQKEAEKVKKDAERHAAKARKQSSSSSSGVYDTPSSTHIIDLKAPNKDLGDDGVCAMADGMEIALRSGTTLASLALEDLNLANNGITTLALARLASVVQLAKYDLKTINLSGNSIEVVTDEQAQQWEAFLLGLKNCMRLRRLDLSGNERLGTRALEILARVHVNEPQITPVPPGGNASVLSLVSENDENDAEASEVDSVSACDDVDDKLNGGRFLQRRCGLRSIPYITLHDIGLLDAGALWLSYVVEDHYYPSQLITELNATNADSIVKAYQQNTHKYGVDWTENPSLGREGVQLLDRTEIIRDRRLKGDTADLADELDVEDTGQDEADSGHANRALTEKGSMPGKPGHRRASIRSIRTTDGGEHEISDLESARKKIMRHIIGHDGVHSVDLWSSSIAVFQASRMILLLAPVLRKNHTGEPLFATQVPAPTTIHPPTPISSPMQENGTGLVVDTEPAKVTSKSPRASYASKLQATYPGANGEPELAITEVTNTPTTPLRLQRPTHRKGAFSAGNDITQVTDKLTALVIRDHSPLRFVRFQQQRIGKGATEGKIFRDRSTATHLPTYVLEHVLSFVVPARDMQVCVGEQRRRAVQRGQDRASLTAEREWLKKDQSAQVLMLLDSLQCLHYGQ